MHLTMRFFGDLEASLARALADRIDGLPAGPAFPARGVRLAGFPEPRRARVLAVDLHAPEIVSLAADLDRVLLELGIPGEERPLRPHVTIARMREPIDVRGLLETATVGGELSGRVTAMTFYESVLGQAGPTYTPLARLVLTSPSSS
jgi:2'-5' RNA ligase